MKKNNYKDLSDVELQQQLEAITDEANKRSVKRKTKEAKVLTINGITPKDIAVRYADWHGDGNLNYSFFVNHDGKLYDFYYDHSVYDKNRKSSFHPWWPIKTHDEHGNAYDPEEDNWEMNGAHDFIPPHFCESMENCYEFCPANGKSLLKDAIKYLKSYGITDIDRHTNAE